MKAIPVFALCLGLAAAAPAQPVLGDDAASVLGKSLHLVQQAEKSAAQAFTDAQRIDLLEQAIRQAQAAPNHRLKGHRVQAIEDLRAAMAAIRQGDPNHSAAGYLHDAEQELNASISIASESAATLPNTPTAAASPAPAVAPATNIVTSTPPPAAADYVPPGVTTAMEQAFLVKYKAALQKQDPDAYFALMAVDPAMDAKAKDALKGLFIFGMAMSVSNPNRNYSFVPIPGDSDEKPTQLVGKMYKSYLPAVVGFKTTFGKVANPSPKDLVAEGDNIRPLCIQNGQLMFIGLKEDPGAVLPPAVDKAANFGIVPGLRKPDLQAEDPDAFTSLDQFRASLARPELTILDSGENPFEYFAICRLTPNMCIWASGDDKKPGNYTFYFKATDKDGQDLKGSQKWIRLVDVPTDTGNAPDVQGTVFFVPDHYSGSIKWEAHYTDEAGKETTFFRTVEWK